MFEVWKDINGFEGVYMVSNHGRVLSINYNHTQKPHIMSQSKSSTGYLHVQLYKNKKPYTRTVHSLVAEAFIPNPANKPEINHIDGNKFNNCCSNLEWNTKSENQIHSISHGLRTSSPNKGKFGALNSRSRKIVQCDTDGNSIHEWDSISDAARALNVHTSSISGCLAGRNKTLRGFTWRYK